MRLKLMMRNQLYFMILIRQEIILIIKETHFNSHLFPQIFIKMKWSKFIGKEKQKVLMLKEILSKSLKTWRLNKLLFQKIKRISVIKGLMQDFKKLLDQTIP